MTDALDRLLDRHGRTYADEAGITLKDEPAPLFQLLVLTHLLSANLSADLGVRAADALRRRYRTAARLADASEDEVHDVLEQARYLRKHRTAHQLHQLADHLVDGYDGDLRRLRDEADGHADRIAERVQEFAGVGPLGSAIFLREVQAVWPSVRPWADDRVLDTARALGLPHTPRGLADRVGTDDLARVGAALVRADLGGDIDEIRTGG